mmetsp:Transcript_25363/g.72377  ORF Transcript_25363/g.72377 Transcript_25363/m.72377 type:complete len:208 (+) Transcript_25363:2011-2634(+)
MGGRLLLVAVHVTQVPGNGRDQARAREAAGGAREGAREVVQGLGREGDPQGLLSVPILAAVVRIDDLPHGDGVAKSIRTSSGLQGSRPRHGWQLEAAAIIQPAAGTVRSNSSLLPTGPGGLRLHLGVSLGLVEHGLTIPHQGDGQGVVLPQEAVGNLVAGLEGQGRLIQLLQEFTLLCDAVICDGQNRVLVCTHIVILPRGCLAHQL